jgi:hypothetical protein
MDWHSVYLRMVFSSAIAMTGPGSHQLSCVIALGVGFARPDGRSGTGAQGESLRVELPGYLRRRGKALGLTSNKRLRTRRERASLASCVGEPLKRNVRCFDYFEWVLNLDQIT